MVLRRLRKKSTVAADPVRVKRRISKKSKTAVYDRVKRRISKKSSVSKFDGVLLPDPLALDAVSDEGWSEMTSLLPDARRKHMHWVLVRTKDPSHKQPHTFTRQTFWEHLVKVYKEVYPEAANATLSILLFGLVAREYHKEAKEMELRDVHFHAATYSTSQHRWKQIAKLSLEKYSVKLHAACHDGYTSMYEYLKVPTEKKPITELDGDAWASPLHPRGDMLKRLLAAGQRSSRALQGRTARRGAQGGDGEQRFRVVDIFSLVRESGIKQALVLQAKAEEMAKGGDDALAKFCTSHGSLRLQEHLNAAWAVLDAPKKLQPPPSRIDKLSTHAREGACVCGGVWKGGAALVLRNNHEDLNLFGRDVCRALLVGARRGVNMGLVGVPGSGKSMMFQPLESIYETMAPPEAGSTFPLASLVKAEVCLWQEFEYDAKTIHVTDLLRLLVGERIAVRVPGEVNIPLNNKAPIFFSSMEPVEVKSGAQKARDAKNKAIEERFNIRTWKNPLPLTVRVPDFPHCGKCFAVFMLENDIAFHYCMGTSGGASGSASSGRTSGVGGTWL